MQNILDQTTRDILGDAAKSLSPVALQNLKECVAVLNDEGRITFMSKGNLSVRAEDHAVGSLWCQIWPDCAQEALKEAITRGFGGRITQYWATFEHLDGSISEWDIRLTPVHGVTKDVKSVIAVSRNLTAH